MRQTHLIAEHFVHHIWDGGYLLPEMKTTDGKKVRVNRRGEWNDADGPDFLHSVIEIDGKEIHGDVEIHLFGGDWQTHGHEKDEKYRRVILHAVMWEDHFLEAQQLVGVQIPTVILSDFLESDLEALRRKIEPIFSQKSHQTLPCEEHIKVLPRDEIIRRVLTAGEWRLNEKIEKFRKRSDEAFWEQVLFEGVMEALGFSRNQSPFLQLARMIPVEILINELKTIEDIQAVLFGLSGLLPPPLKEDKEKESIQYVEDLHDRWRNWRERFSMEPLGPGQWTFYRQRPANFPTVRLAGISFLYRSIHHRGLFSLLHQLFQNFPTGEDIEKAFSIEGTGYWTRHYQFYGKPHAPQQQLIGKERIRDILINVVIPIFYLFSEKTNNQKLKHTISDFYQNIRPSAENEITRSLYRQIFGTQRIKNSARLQQGLIGIYKTFCREHHCDVCVMNALVVPR